MTDSTAKNLRAIQNAIDAHAKICAAQVIEIRMNPFEVERLDFDDFNGIPIVADEEMQTGRVRIICEAERPPTEGNEITEAVGTEVFA